MNHSNVVFIIGPHKTGTSTVNGLLNCSPRVLVLYEVELFGSAITKYGHRLVEACPELRPLLGVAERWIDPYIALAGTLSALGHDYSLVGDKIVSMEPGLLDRFDGARLVVTGCRFSTWCCKRQIINGYRTDLDLIPAARDSLRFWTIAGMRPSVMRVPLEYLVEKTTATCQRLAGRCVV